MGENLNIYNFAQHCVFSGKAQDVSDTVITCLIHISAIVGVNPFAKEAGSPVKPSLTPSE